MHITGGTYLEYVIEPGWYELFGSGLRAACALAKLAGNIKFHTYVDDNYKSVLQARAESFNIKVQNTITRQRPISFEYFTPLSSSIVVGCSDKKQNRGLIEITSEEAILRYGMMEGEAVVHGKKVVYDPQSPIAPKSFYDNGSTAEELAIILNRREAIALSGKKNEAEIIAELFTYPTTKIIIIKDGPCGANLYCRGQEKIPIPAYKTDFVFSIGSGDVFSAVFALFWAERGVHPHVAAEKASIATAIYVSSRGINLPLNEKQLEDDPQFPRIFPNVNIAKKKIYLAGPFFTMESRWFIEETLRIFQAMGISVFSPLHNIGFGTPQKVYPADINGLQGCNIVFANLCGLDSGTLYEVGYARSKDIPVIVFIQNHRQEDLTMLIGSKCRIFHDYTSAVYNTVWDALTL